MTLRLRNDATGYVLVTKSLHWLTVVALAAQLMIGYSRRSGRPLARRSSAGARGEAPWEPADDDLLLAGQVTHVTFFVTLAIHVGLVLKHQLVDRDRLLNRLL